MKSNPFDLSRQDISFLLATGWTRIITGSFTCFQSHKYALLQVFNEAKKVLKKALLVYHIMLERFKSKSQNTSLPTKCQRCPSKKQLATRCKPTRPYSISGWMKTWGCVCEIIAVIVAAFTQRSRKRAPSRRVTSEICEYAVRWPMILRVHKILLKFQNKAETADVSMRSMFEKRCHKHCSHLL